VSCLFRAAIPDELLTRCARCAVRICSQYNCNAQMMCVAPPEAPLKVGAWGYAVVALAISISKCSAASLCDAILPDLTLFSYTPGFCSLWKVHKSGSAKKRAELDEYYKEQLASVVLVSPCATSR
jgi:hypothetical protein